MINLNNLLLIEIVSSLVLFYSIMVEYKLFNIMNLGINKEFISDRYISLISNIRTILKTKNAEEIIFLYTFTFLSVICLFLIYLNILKPENIFIINVYLVFSTVIILMHFLIQYKMYLKHAISYKRFSIENNNLKLNDYIESTLINIKRDEKYIKLETINDKIFSPLINYNEYKNSVNKMKEKNEHLENINPLDEKNFYLLLSKFSNYYSFIKVDHDTYILEKNIGEKDGFIIQKINIEYNSMFYSLYKSSSEFSLKLGMYIEVILFFIILNSLIFSKFDFFSKF